MESVALTVAMKPLQLSWQQVAVLGYI